MRCFVDNELAAGKFIGRLLKGGGVARPRAIPIMKSVREALLRLGLHGAATRLPSVLSDHLGLQDLSEEVVI